MTNKTIVAARYVRNSDPSKQDSEVQKVQADALADYAKKMGWECPDNLLYKDAISALKHPYWERPALMKLWDDAERGMFDVVLCTEFFRIARETAEQYAVIEYFKRYKVQLISITEKFEDTKEGQLLFALQGFLGTAEAEKIRIRTVRGKVYRASRALTGQGSHPMYGYEFVAGQLYARERYVLNLRVIHIDETGTEWTEVKVIEFCVDSCLKGMSLYQIALTLTRLGIPTQLGRVAWDATTIRKFLTNICYTGEGVNGRYAKEQAEEQVALAAGIYPKIIDRSVFDQVQEQLTLNAEMSLRNNKHPQDGLLRGRVYCGLCGHKMMVKHYNKPGGHRHTKVKPTTYYCYQNNGLADIKYHHTITITLENLDRDAWQFVLPYIRDTKMVREHIASLKQQVGKRDLSQDLEKDIERIKKSIANLIKLAEGADPSDSDSMQALQARLSVLQRDKRDKEKLLANVESLEDRQEKLLAALDRFEAWTLTMRPYLIDPQYEISWDDKREAILIMGVKAVVWPASPEYEDRVKLTILPPDIAKFCDYDLMKKAVSGRSTW